MPVHTSKPHKKGHTGSAIAPVFFLSYSRSLLFVTAFIGGDFNNFNLTKPNRIRHISLNFELTVVYFLR